MYELKKRIAIEAVKLELLLLSLTNQQKLDKAAIEKRLQDIKESLFHISEDAKIASSLSAVGLYKKRIVPLLLTAFIGILVACVLSFYDKVIAKYAAIYVFSPLVSALAGNYGLQVASKEIRAIATQEVEGLWKLTMKECGAGLLTGITLGSITGVLGWIITGHYLAVPVIIAALTSGVVTAALMGSLMPYIFHKLGLDPAFLVGPFETTLQDLASYFTFVVSLIIFGRLLGV